MLDTARPWHLILILTCICGFGVRGVVSSLRSVQVGFAQWCLALPWTLVRILPGALCVLGFSVPSWLCGFSLEQFSGVFLPLLKLKFLHCLLTLSRCWKGFDENYQRRRCRRLSIIVANLLICKCIVGFDSLQSDVHRGLGNLSIHHRESWPTDSAAGYIIQTK